MTYSEKYLTCFLTFSFSSSSFFFFSSSTAIFSISFSRRLCSARSCFLVFGLGYKLYVNNFNPDSKCLIFCLVEHYKIFCLNYGKEVLNTLPLKQELVVVCLSLLVAVQKYIKIYGYNSNYFFTFHYLNFHSECYEC